MRWWNITLSVGESQLQCCLGTIISSCADFNLRNSPHNDSSRLSLSSPLVYYEAGSFYSPLPFRGTSENEVGDEGSALLNFYISHSVICLSFHEVAAHCLRHFEGIWEDERYTLYC